MSHAESSVSCAYNVENFTGSLPVGPEVLPLGAYVFLCREIPFDFVTQIKVSYRKKDITGSFILNKANPFKMLVPTIFNKKETATLMFDLDFVCQTGNYKRSNQTASFMNFIYNPFTPRTMQFLPMGMEGKTPYTDRIKLSYYYQEKGPGWEISGIAKQVILTPGATTCILDYPVVNPERAVVVYEGTIMTSDGGVKSIPQSTSNQCIVPVGFEVSWNSTEVDASQVNWATYQMVKVYLYATVANDSTPTGSESPVGVLTFNRSSGSLYWGYLNMNAALPSFSWRAAYYLEPFLDPITTATREESFSGFLMLPKDPMQKYEQ